MIIWAYDKTFEGFLTLVFECFELKAFPEKMVSYDALQEYLFGQKYEVFTNDQKAQRVWTGLQNKISGTSCQTLYYAFLSEEPDIETVLLQYVRTVFSSPVNNEMNFGDASVLKLNQLRRTVLREAERMRMFVRFQKTADNMYYASFDPKYNVLPLVTDHFEQRFADQQWVIYDTHRKYGFYYNLHTTTEVRFTENRVHPLTGQIDPEIMAEDEQKFQELWKSYFDAMCIKERINPRLHMQLLPKRFWKYLPEKQSRR